MYSHECKHRGQKTRMLLTSLSVAQVTVTLLPNTDWITLFPSPTGSPHTFIINEMSHVGNSCMYVWSSTTRVSWLSENVGNKKYISEGGGAIRPHIWDQLKLGCFYKHRIKVCINCFYGDLVPLCLAELIWHWHRPCLSVVPEAIYQWRFGGPWRVTSQL